MLKLWHEIASRICLLRFHGDSMVFPVIFVQLEKASAKSRNWGDTWWFQRLFDVYPDLGRWSNLTAIFFIGLRKTTSLWPSIDGITSSTKTPSKLNILLPEAFTRSKQATCPNSLVAKGWMVGVGSVQWFFPNIKGISNLMFTKSMIICHNL